MFSALKIVPGPVGNNKIILELGELRAHTSVSDAMLQDQEYMYSVEAGLKRYLVAQQALPRPVRPSTTSEDSMSDLVTVLSARKNELAKSARELTLIEELLGLHAAPKPSTTEAETKAFVAARAARVQSLAMPATPAVPKAKPRKTKKTTPSVLQVLRDVVRDHKNQTLDGKEIIDLVKAGCKLVGNKAKDPSIATTVMGRGKECGLVRTRPGRYRCVPSKSTYAPIIPARLPNNLTR